MHQWKNEKEFMMAELYKDYLVTTTDGRVLIAQLVNEHAPPYGVRWEALYGEIEVKAYMELPKPYKEE